MMNFLTKTKRRGVSLAGIFGTGAISLLLLCGAGLTPAGNVMTADVNASGHNLTNVATLSSTNVIVTGSLAVPAGFTVPYANVSGTPTIPTRVGQLTNDVNFVTASAAASAAPVQSVAGRTGAVTLSSGDISGLAASATTDTTSAANIASGTLSFARIPIGTTSSTVAVGNDARFPAGVTGIRLGNGAGGNDAALVIGSGLSLTTGTLTATGGGSGSVTSVGLSVPGAIYSVTGSPVTTSGSLTLNLVNQNANTIFAGPSSGPAGAPSFRALASADIPSNAANTSGSAGSIGTSNAAGSSAAQSSLQNLGAEGNSVVAKSASFTVAQSDAGKVFNVTTGTSAIVATLPGAPSLPSGWTIYVRKADSAAGTVANDAGTFLITSTGHTEKITSDGINYITRAWFGGITSTGDISISNGANKNINLVTSGTGSTQINGVAFGALATVVPGSNVAAALAYTTNAANGPVVSGSGGLDAWSFPQPTTIPTGSAVCIIGDSIQAGYTGGGASPTTFPALTMSAQPAFAGIPIYVFAISGTTAGPTSAQANSGLALMASGSYSYTKFLNGAQTATGSATVGSIYSTLTGSGNLYFFANYGANDVAGINSMTFANYKTSMSSIWTTAHGYGSNVKVVACTMMDLSINNTPVAKSTTILWNKWLRGQTMAVQGSGAGFSDYLCDLNAFFTDATVGTTTGDIWSNDGLHPTPIGSRMIGYLMSDAIARSITLPVTLGQTSSPVTNASNTFTAAQTVNVTAGYPLVLSNSTSSAGASGIFNFTSPNSPTGGMVGLMQIGAGGGTGNNLVQIGLQYAGNGSALNYLDLGLNTSTSHKGIKIYASGQVDMIGPVNLSATQSTVSGATSGSAIFSEPYAGSTYKKVVVHLAALSGAASYTFPTAFSFTPLVVNSDADVTSLSSTAMTVTPASAPRTGTIILEGY